MKWDHVISLGFNCEVSFQIQKCTNMFEASLFSWAFIADDDLFLGALKNLDSLFANEIQFSPERVDMFQCKNFNIFFHGRVPYQQLMQEDSDQIDEKKYKEALDELKSRLEHLKEKFICQLSTKESTIFIRKIEIRGDLKEHLKFIENLNNYLAGHYLKGEYLLLIIVEEKYYSFFARYVMFPNTEVRCLKYFAPVDDTKDGADDAGWEQIFSEFLDAEQLVFTKQYKENLNIEVLRKQQFLAEQIDNYVIEKNNLEVLLHDKSAWLQKLYEAIDWMEEQNLLQNTDGNINLLALANSKNELLEMQLMRLKKEVAYLVRTIDLVNTEIDKVESIKRDFNVSE